MDVDNNEKSEIVLYSSLLSDIKIRISKAQVKATLSANDTIRKQPVSLFEDMKLPGLPLLIKTWVV
jgi:hypothetical protein